VHFSENKTKQNKHFPAFLHHLKHREDKSETLNPAKTFVDVVWHMFRYQWLRGWGLSCVAQNFLWKNYISLLSDLKL
jgi:hypothetical protein